MLVHACLTVTGARTLLHWTGQSSGSIGQDAHVMTSEQCSCQGLDPIMPVSWHGVNPGNFTFVITSADISCVPCYKGSGALMAQPDDNSIMSLQALSCPARGK